MAIKRSTLNWRNLTIFKPKKKFVKEPEPGDKNKNVKTKKRPYWIHIIHVILFFIAYLFYFISLNRCFDGEDVCSTRPNWLVLILVTLTISIIISSVLFLMMILCNKAIQSLLRRVGT